MFTKNVTNLQDGFLTALKEVMDTGGVVTVRDQETREIQTVVLEVENPRERIICVPYRQNNVFAMIAETLWVIGGRNDIAYLSKFLPRAADFSDDGIVWRAGYGPRIRSYKGVYTQNVDQVRECARMLYDDPTTRRAVISIFNPDEDFIKKTLDVPCNNWLHLLVRDGYLNATIAVRSNDVVWGMSAINMFEWSVLMELMAVSTDNKVGKMKYLADSCHVYEKHYNRANRIIDYALSKEFVDMYSMGFSPIPIMVTGLGDWDDQNKSILTAIDSNMLTENYIMQHIFDPFLKECANMLMLWNEISTKSSEIPDVVNKLTIGGDFRLAALEYLMRQEFWKEIISDIHITTEEQNFLAQFPTE